MLSLIHADITISYSLKADYFFSSTVKRLPSTLPADPLPDLRADKGGDCLDLYLDYSRLMAKLFAILLYAFLESALGEFSV